MTKPEASGMNEVRRAAWATRRAKYGPTVHAPTAYYGPSIVWYGLHGMLCLFCGLRFHSWPDLIEHFERRHGRVVFP